MIDWIDFLDQLPEPNRRIVIKHGEKIYTGFRENSETIFIDNELTDGNCVLILYKRDWDLGGFKWKYGMIMK